MFHGAAEEFLIDAITSIPEFSWDTRFRKRQTTDQRNYSMYNDTRR